MSTLLVFSTFPDMPSARKAARILVDAHLAACVNLLPAVSSVYRWQERIEESEEVLAMIKTTSAAYPLLESGLKACHPYELPEILAVAPKSGLPGYMDWVAEQTGCIQPEAEKQP